MPYAAKVIFDPPFVEASRTALWVASERLSNVDAVIRAVDKFFSPEPREIGGLLSAATARTCPVTGLGLCVAISNAPPSVILELEQEMLYQVALSLVVEVYNGSRRLDVSLTCRFTTIAQESANPQNCW